MRVTREWNRAEIANSQLRVGKAESESKSESEVLLVVTEVYVYAINIIHIDKHIQISM